MNTPPPPSGFRSWTEHIKFTVLNQNPPVEPFPPGFSTEVSNEEREGARLLQIDAGVKRRQQRFDLISEWWPQIAIHVDRTFEDIVYNGFQKKDYPDTGVQLQFADGTNLSFTNAFYCGAPSKDQAREEVIVFTKNHGHYLFAMTVEDRVVTLESTNPQSKH